MTELTKIDPRRDLVQFAYNHRECVLQRRVNDGLEESPKRGGVWSPSTLYWQEAHPIDEGEARAYAEEIGIDLYAPTTGGKIPPDLPENRPHDVADIRERGWAIDLPYAGAPDAPQPLRYSDGETFEEKFPELLAPHGVSSDGARARRTLAPRKLLRRFVGRGRS